jgi:hypothetical protein
MSSDDFLDRLRADWRGPSVDLERMRRLTARRRRLQSLVRALTPLGALTCLLLGLWLGWGAVTNGEAILAVGAAALLIAAPLLLIELAEARRASRIRYDDTPRGVLQQAYEQVRYARTALRGYRWSASILAVAAVLVLAIRLAGWSSDPAAFAIALTWIAVAALTWAVGVWRAGRLGREAQHCEQMLAELDAAEEGAQGD